MSSGNLIPCLCGSHNIVVLGLKDGYQVTQCEICSLVFVNPQPSAEQIQEFYSSVYWNEHQLKVGRETLTERISNKSEIEYFEGVLGWLLGRVSSQSHRALLEVGCSHGIFCELASSKGFEVTGVEVDETIARQTQERTGLNILWGGLSDQDFGCKQFDVVALFDVIEHFPDPAAALEQISAFSKSDAWLYLSTPCRDTREAQLNVMQWGENKPPEHLYLFSYENLKNLLLLKGFYVWDAFDVYSDRMFLLARKVSPDRVFSPPSLKVAHFKSYLKEIEKKLRCFFKKRY